MRRTVFQAATIAVMLMAATALAWGSAIENHIRDLKSDDPEVRAKAAYELGCG